MQTRPRPARLLFLGCGTSTGVPVPACRCAVCTSSNPRNSRLRTSVLLEVEGAPTILVDTTPDLRQQALHYNLTRIDAVLYTHHHADHILGLDDLRGFNFAQGCDIPCFGSRATLNELRRIFRYVFSHDPTYIGGAPPQASLREIDELQLFEFNSLPIQSFPLLHGGLRTLGYRFGSLAYATDCKAIPDVSQDVLQDLDVLIIDGLRYEPHRTHFSIPEAIEQAHALGARRTILTHMTHTVDYETVSAALPPGIELAYDGMIVDFEF